jgi:hypothetical protein
MTTARRVGAAPVSPAAWLLNDGLPWILTLVAVLVWAVPLHLGWYAGHSITDVPVYESAWRHIAAGDVPYRDFSLEYPPLAAGLFWLAGALPGHYGVTFSILMLAALVATLLGVLATARALGLDTRRQTAAGLGVALSPLLIGNLVETRFDLLLAAFLAWMLYAAVTERWRTMWLLFALATLTKLVPLALVPALVLWQRHRTDWRTAWRGGVAGLGLVALVLAPFVALSPSGVWHLAQYHIDRPLQIESTGAAYLLVLHVLADVPLRVVYGFGSQGLGGRGPDAVALISTIALVVVTVAIAWTLAALLRRARPPGDARLLMAASAATLAALLAGGKVLSPQFVIWLLPAGFLVCGRYGWGAFAGTAVVMVLTQLYFPDRYWDLVALEHGPIGLVALRDAAILALVALAWPRRSVELPRGRVLPSRAVPAPSGAAERAVAARYLTD